MALANINPIDRYLTHNGVTVESYAERSERSPSTVYSYLNGSRRPLKKHYCKLAEASGGEITVDQLDAFFRRKPKKSERQ